MLPPLTNVSLPRFKLLHEMLKDLPELRELREREWGFGNKR